MTWIVDVLPLLRFLPGWLPGVKFQETSRSCKKVIGLANDVPYSCVQRQIAKGIKQTSLVSSMMQRSVKSSEGKGNFNNDIEEAIKYSAAILHTAGIETTVSVIRAFVFAMATHTQVQQQAQEEIDNVISTTRLPDLEDQKKLPYVSAVVKEALR